MPCITARHYAVKEINSSVNALNYILRCSDTHKISRLILWHIRLNNLDYAVHFLGALANRKSADSIAVTLNLGYRFHILYTQILIRAALVNTEKHLMGVYSSLERIESVKLGTAALEPAYGALLGILYVFIGRGVFHTLVKRHSDSRAEI